MKKMLSEVLDKITPKTVPSEAETFLKELNNSLKKKKIKAKAVLGGSFEKETWLLGDHDVDVFVQFDLSYKGKDISSILKQVLKNPETVHGSRDYFHLKNILRYEIVPVLNIKKASEAVNVTDFSPWHVKWVNTKGKKLKGDIRLFKKFCKAQGVYGAESYIAGFSGHVVDIITIYYGGFEKAVKAIAKWKPKTVIDPTKKYGKNALIMLNQSKIEGPLIVLDPVQPDRNASAAVGMEKFGKLIKSAQEFLKRPSSEFFDEKPLDFERMKKQGELVRLQIVPKKGKEDVMGAQILKVIEHMRKQLSDFTIAKEGWQWKMPFPAIAWFIVKEKELPAEKKIMGPPAEMKEFVASFKKKHRKTQTEKGRVIAIEKREYRTAEKAIREHCNDAYITERAKCKMI